MKKRTVALLMAVVLVLGAGIGGTLAWLLAETKPIVNTFTVGDINITLTEEAGDTITDIASGGTNHEFKMVPNKPLAKDPKVTVEAKSEACYLFVKIDESSTLKDYISYGVRLSDSDWKVLDAINHPGVYYREVDAATAKAGASYYVLTGSEANRNGEVTVKDTVTKTMMENLGKADAVQPTLTFTAYACQSSNLSDVNGDGNIDQLDAWKLASTSAA